DDVHERRSEVQERGRRAEERRSEGQHEEGDREEPEQDARGTREHDAAEPARKRLPARVLLEERATPEREEEDERDDEDERRPDVEVDRRDRQGADDAHGRAAGDEWR